MRLCRLTLTSQLTKAAALTLLGRGRLIVRFNNDNNTTYIADGVCYGVWQLPVVRLHWTVLGHLSEASQEKGIIGYAYWKQLKSVFRGRRGRIIHSIRSGWKAGAGSDIESHQRFPYRRGRRLHHH